MGEFFSGIGKIIGSIFGGDEGPAPSPGTPAAAPVVTPAPVPVVAATPVMPIPDDVAVKQANRQKLARQTAQRSSRQNSILSQDDSDVLGG